MSYYRKTYGVALFVVMTLVGCTVFEGSSAWEILEPADEEEISQCPQVEEQWASDDFVMGLYYYVACHRGHNDNFVVSPTAVRLALGERAMLSDGTDPEALAGQLGYVDSQSMYHSGEDIRAELLDRKPTSYTIRTGELSEAEMYFEEEDPERLRRALGIEFYSVKCIEAASHVCAWTAQNDRWDGENFFDSVSPHEFGETGETTAMILRGYTRSGSISPPSGVPTTRILDFRDVNGESIPTVDVIVSGRYSETSEGIFVLEWSLVGQEVSVIFVGSPDLNLEETERSFLAKPITDWISRVENQPYSRTTKRRIRIPVFDIEDSFDVQEHFELHESLYTATRLNLFGRKEFPRRSVINQAERLSARKVEGGIVGGGPQNLDEKVKTLVNFNSPFLFILYDRPTETVLKIGRVARP